MSCRAGSAMNDFGHDDWTRRKRGDGKAACLIVMRGLIFVLGNAMDHSCFLQCSPSRIYYSTTSLLSDPTAWLGNIASY